MSAPAQTASDEEVDEEVTVYDHRTDPFVGEFVVFATGDDVIAGEVLEGRERSDGSASVVVERRKSGETATLPWSAVDVLTTADGTECAACGFPSRDCYRCEACGHDLAGQGATVARDGGDA